MPVVMRVPRLPLLPDHRPGDARGGSAAQRGAHPRPAQRRPAPGGAAAGRGQREALPGALLRQQAHLVRRRLPSGSFAFDSLIHSPPLQPIWATNSMVTHFINLKELCHSLPTKKAM